MAQQTCCVSSRPASRLIARSLFGASSKPRFAKRLGRIARRSVAAMLIVGGTGLGVAPATITAHDHMPAVDETVPTDAVAHPIAARLTSDAMLDQWISSVAAAETVCGPARDRVEVVLGGGGVQTIHPTTASQWQEYCKLRDLLAWGDQAKHFTSPLIRTAQTAAVELSQTDGSVVATPSRELMRGLSDLSCEEPIDVDSPAEAGGVGSGAEDAEESVVAVPSGDDADASDSPKFGSAAFVGGGPMVMTIAESYLAYDLSPEDAIAMRMYPIDGPMISGAPISYLGARRTSIYGPVPNFQASGNWHQQVEPGIVLSTPAAHPPAIEVAALVVPPESAVPESTVHAIGDLVKRVVVSVQPDSELRHIASAPRLGKRVGEAAGAGLHAADLAVGEMTTRLATVWQPPPQQRPLIAPPAARSIAGARLETPRPATDATVITEPAEDVEAARLMQIELACKAALDVVRQQACRGAVHELPATDISASAETIAEPIEVASIAAMANEAAPVEDTAVDELVRAQAVATACDLAAATLEQLAMSLRRAGDSLVRQAKATGGANPSLRR